MTITQGVLLNERYRLDELIATGGMGQVWRATDELLGRLVAVKVVQGGGGSNAGTTGESDFRARFRDEARNSAALSHPNIATVYDFGDDADQPFLVMELVEGQSLAQVIAERGALPPEEVRSIIAQAALALQVAHTAGVVHRDVKPANIMLTPAGLVKLTDFGIARVAAGSGLTRTGEVLGTPHYLSPEQAQGQAATASSDVYALGVVGHELLTGQRPFQGESLVATALAHVNQPAPELPESVPQPLRGALMAALAKDPADRPATAGELATMIGMPVGPLTPRGGIEVVGGARSAEATEMLPERTPTTVLPLPAAGAAMSGVTVSGAAPSEEAVSDTPTRSRRGGLWWLLPLGGLLAVLAIILAVALSGGSKTPAGNATTPGSPAGAATTTAPPTTGTTPSTTSAPTRSPSPTTRPSTTVHSSPQPAPATHAGKGKGGKKK